MTDPQGNCTFISNSATEITGYSVPELLGRSWASIVHPDDRDTMVATHYAQHADPHCGVVQYRIVTKEGGVRQITSQALPVYDDDGNLKGLIGTSIDVTGRMPVEPPCYISQMKADVRPLSRKQLSRRKPTIAFDLDGTLANIVQGFLDAATGRGILGLYNWNDVLCGGRCEVCTSALCLGNGKRRPGETLSKSQWSGAVATALSTPNFYRDLEPFDLDELESIGSHMLGNDFVAYFVATRRDLSLNTPDDSDARIQTQVWLTEKGLNGYMGIVADARDVTRELLIRSVEFYLDDDPDEVQHARAAGIDAWLITRPWNVHVECEFRVESVRQFIEEVVLPASEKPVNTAVETAMCAYTTNQ